jgi:N-acetylglucosaminyldiphosphoundecaprenol N-acetyl-beta-D-mannosaminyltransferase
MSTDQEETDDIRSARILGTPVSIVSMDRVLRLFEMWTAKRSDRYVVVRDVHGVMRARSELDLRTAHETADLTVPDGMPLVWVAKLARIKGISRVCGPDLLPAVCQRGLRFGWRHFFLGGAPGIAERAIERLEGEHPGIAIAGSYCPPFRELNKDEDEEMCALIRASRADFVWVGLGTPKQELWMKEHRGQCGGVIMLGVGAVFDLAAGASSRAPGFMQKRGLEWLFRLAHEPRRLWRRYLVLGPKFVVLALTELALGGVTTFGTQPSLPDRSNAPARLHE